jgi:hypothetical protein
MSKPSDLVQGTQCYLLRRTQSHQPALEFATLVRRQNERGNDTGHN